MSTIIVIRPSGIWNSRSPLNNYIQEQRALSKAVAVISLSIYNLRCDLKEEMSDRSGRQVFKQITKKSAPASKHWLNYRRSHGNSISGRAIQPTVTHLWKDSYVALAEVQEHAIVRLSSMFESFAQCWILNYLLALLESSNPLTTKELKLVESFNPLLSRHMPGFPQILNAVPELEMRLSKLPHLFNDPCTGNKVDQPLSENLTALSAVLFWRAYRNQVVHYSRLVTRPFHKKYAAFFEEATKSFPHISQLEPGKPLPFHDDLYGSMAASHLQAALHMNEWLVDLTKERRGHPEAPNRKTTEFWEVAPPSPQLLLNGDHQESYLWASDESARLSTAQNEGWKL